MKLVYAASAMADLERIYDYQARNWPGVRKPFEEALARIEQRILVFPKSAPAYGRGTNVRVATFSRYPYRLFYRIGEENIEIIHIRNTSRKPLHRK